MKAGKANSIALAHQIIDMLNEHRRESRCHHHGHHECLALHVDKLTALVTKGERIRFVLPAFPAKSPNLNKTYGVLPDLGEQLALCFLNQLCVAIEGIYPSGADIMICSDGRVFNDLLGISDYEVDAYSQTIRDIIEEQQLTHILLFSLDDYFDNMPGADMRENLMTAFGEPEERFRYNIKHNAFARQQFNGIHRFVFEDNTFVMNALSRNKIRNLSKDIAYQVVRRSNAWSALVEARFPEALRLSIHPQVCGSNKIGLMLLKAADQWATPWHRVVVYDGYEHRLMTRRDAETLGAKPVFVKEAFSHYRFEGAI